MLVDCVDLDALEREARRVMRPESWVFCDTGADDEITAKENIAAWRALKLRPRVLRDIVEIDTSVKIGRASCRERCRSRWSPYHEKKKEEKAGVYTPGSSEMSGVHTT